MREIFTQHGICLEIEVFIHWLFRVFPPGTGNAKEKSRNPFDSRRNSFRFARLSRIKRNNNTTEL
jgi:hypothetical protein